MNPDVTVRDARRDGEVHLLRAAHRARRASRRASRGAAIDGRRAHHRLPAGLPDAGHRLRQPERPEVRGVASCTRTSAATTLLHELGTRPRTAYLVRIRNPNPELEHERRDRERARRRGRKRSSSRSSGAARSSAGRHRRRAAHRDLLRTRLGAAAAGAGSRCSALRRRCTRPALHRDRLHLRRTASAPGATTSRSAWAFGIINFVWWIGIGHAGTLISAILLLFQQKWRTSINRFAEAMTLFAVMLRGPLPAAAPRPALVRLLALPLPEHAAASGRSSRAR